MKFLSLTFLILSFVGCVSSPKSPEGVLSLYVQGRFAGKSIDDLKSYLSSGYLDKIAEVRDGKYERLENIKQKKYKVISKNCSDDVCKLTYFISYITLENGRGEFLTETKKVASMLKRDDLWLIDDIGHVKTYHDIKAGIEISD